MTEHGIKQARYCYIKKSKDDYIFVEKDFTQKELGIDYICNLIEEKLLYPMFVKPSKGGSSIGITKVNNKNELYDAINNASKYDYKILIEEAIIGREIECAVLEENGKAKASCLGEIITADEFYSYDAKYKNNTSRLIIPAKLQKEHEIKKLAIKAFNAIDGTGIARVDFFITEENIYINEINTMPGFTNISMYAKLWKNSGIEYEKLINKLIENAIKKR